MIAKLVVSIAPMVIALVAVLVFFLPEGDELEVHQIWIPENGVQGSFLEVLVHLDDDITSSREIKTVPLGEFKSRDYPEIVYGFWSYDLVDENFLFYWAPDPAYPQTGVWARVPVDPGFGQIVGFPESCSGDTFTVPMEQNLLSGHTPIPRLPPHLFYFWVGFGAVVSSHLLFYLLTRRNSPKEPSVR